MLAGTKIGQAASTVPAMTARQRAELAKLRIQHKRARVVVPSSRTQSQLPLVRVRMFWPTVGGGGASAGNGRRRSVTLWICPDGSRLLSGSALIAGAELELERAAA